MNLPHAPRIVREGRWTPRLGQGSPEPFKPPSKAPTRLLRAKVRAELLRRGLVKP